MANVAFGSAAGGYSGTGGNAALQAAIDKANAAKNIPWTGGAPWLDPTKRSYVGGNSAMGPGPAAPNSPSNGGGGGGQPQQQYSDMPAASPWTPYSGPSGDAMAKAQYAAQYALLDKMRGDTTKSYTDAGNQMGGIYDALSKSMSGQTAGIQKQYADSGSAIGNSYNNAIASTNAGYDKSRGALEQLAANLGIQAGLPSAEQHGYDQQNFLSGLMKANQANDTSYNTNMGQNNVSYNTRNAQIEQNMGVSSRADFANRMQTALSGIADKRLTVTGNQAQSANDYAMKIAQMNSDSKSAWNTNETNRQSAWNKDQTDKAGQMIAIEHEKNIRDAEAAKQAASNRAASTDTSKMNAYQILASSADVAYNHNARDAQRAMKIIQDLWDGGWNGDKKWSGSSDFYNDVARSNPAAASSQLSALANMFYAKMAGGATKAFDGGIGRNSWTDANGT